MKAGFKDGWYWVIPPLFEDRLPVADWIVENIGPVDETMHYNPVNGKPGVWYWVWGKKKIWFRSETDRNYFVRNWK
jgi:hypothetical protein